MVLRQRISNYFEYKVDGNVRGRQTEFWALQLDPTGLGARDYAACLYFQWWEMCAWYEWVYIEVITMIRGIFCERLLHQSPGNRLWWSTYPWKWRVSWRFILRSTSRTCVMHAQRRWFSWMRKRRLIFQRLDVRPYRGTVCFHHSGRYFYKGLLWSQRCICLRKLNND